MKGLTMHASTYRRPATALLAGLICGMCALGVQAAPQLAPAQQTVAQAPASVTNIDFKRSEGGGGKLTISFSGDGATPDLRNQGANVVVNLGNSRVPATQARSLNVADFATPVQRIDSQGNQIVLGTNGAFESMAYQRGREYIVEILPRAAQVAQGGLSSTIAGTAQAVAANNARPVYRGRPVNFNFQDVPVRTVLQLIAEESGLNIVASDTVAGNVTLRLVNVPWDQALDIILQAKGLDKRRSGSVIWVAPQAEIAKYEQDKEDARINLENRQEMVTEYFRINYHSAIAIYKALTEAKGIGGAGGGGQGGNQQGAGENGFLSPRGRLVADERTNTLMISDIPKKVEAMRALINEVDRPVDQVVIESRIVIATESFARDLGARFGVSSNYQRTNGRHIVSGNVADTTSIGNGDGRQIPSGLMFNLPATPVSGISAAGIAYTLLGANFQLDVELSAMQEQQRGEVSSNPRILTTNQRESVIQQGREIGYVTVTASTGGVVTPTVAFKDVLLELRVTPTITNDDRVFLNMKVSKNELDSWLNTSIGQVPIIAKRQIDTAALIENGQTVVIGGVYEFKDQESIAKVPFLADIPVIGNLFKRKSRSNDKVELLIFMTPKILRVQQRVH